MSSMKEEMSSMKEMNMMEMNMMEPMEYEEEGRTGGKL